MNYSAGIRCSGNMFTEPRVLAIRCLAMGYSGVMLQYLQFTVNLYRPFYIIFQILECNKIHFRRAYFVMKYQT
jgi:hypothetical protein